MVSLVRGAELRSNTVQKFFAVQKSSDIKNFGVEQFGRKSVFFDKIGVFLGSK